MYLLISTIIEPQSNGFDKKDLILWYYRNVRKGNPINIHVTFFSFSSKCLIFLYKNFYRKRFRMYNRHEIRLNLRTIFIRIFYQTIQQQFFYYVLISLLTDLKNRLNNKIHTEKSSQV